MEIVLGLVGFIIAVVFYKIGSWSGFDQGYTRAGELQRRASVARVKFTPAAAEPTPVKTKTAKAAKSAPAKKKAAKRGPGRPRKQK